MSEIKPIGIGKNLFCLSVLVLARWNQVEYRSKKKSRGWGPRRPYAPGSDAYGMCAGEWVYIILNIPLWC